MARLGTKTRFRAHCDRPRPSGCRAGLATRRRSAPMPAVVTTRRASNDAVEDGKLQQPPTVSWPAPPPPQPLGWARGRKRLEAGGARSRRDDATASAVVGGVSTFVGRPHSLAVAPTRAGPGLARPGRLDRSGRSRAAKAGQARQAGRRPSPWSLERQSAEAGVRDGLRLSRGDDRLWCAVSVIVHAMEAGAGID